MHGAPREAPRVGSCDMAGVRVHESEVRDRKQPTVSEPRIVDLDKQLGSSIGRSFTQSVQHARVGDRDVVLTTTPPWSVHVQDVTTGELLFEAAFATDLPNRPPLLSAVSLSQDSQRMAIAGTNFFAMVRLDARETTVEPIPGMRSKGAEVERHFKIDMQTTPEFFRLLPAPIEVTWSPGDRLVMTTAKLEDGSGIIRLWDPVTGEQWGATATEFPLVQADQPSTGFARDLMAMYAVMEHGVEVYDLVEARKAFTVYFPKDMKIVAGEVSPDMRALVVALEKDGRQEVGIYDMNTREVIVGGPVGHGEKVRWARFHSTRPVVTILTDFKLMEVDFVQRRVTRTVALDRPKVVRDKVPTEYRTMERSYVRDDTVVVTSGATVPSIPPNVMGNKEVPNRPFGDDVLLYNVEP